MIALPSFLVLEPLLRSWILEDVGRGDCTADNLFADQVADLPINGQATWTVKEAGVVAGLPIAAQIFQLVDQRVEFAPTAAEGTWCEAGQVIARLSGPMRGLLTGERVALNVGMRLSGIATLTRKYADRIADLPVHLVDTRKTTPGLRLLEKYATRVGGAVNHRMGLDDAVMIKDNHIAAAGGIGNAVRTIRQRMPYPLTIEVETETLEQVEAALQAGADIIMLDNMALETMGQAVHMIRQSNERIKIEASGNITLETIRAVAEAGVDYVSSSAPITRSTWLDLSMRIGVPGLADDSSSGIWV